MCSCILAVASSSIVFTSSFATIIFKTKMTRVIAIISVLQCQLKERKPKKIIILVSTINHTRYNFHPEGIYKGPRMVSASSGALRDFVH